MPSSTSNSDRVADRVPSRHGGRTWAITIGLTLAVLTVAEVGFRAVGHRPTVVDGPPLWSTKRAEVSDDLDHVVVLGNSRMQFGFDTDTFRDRHPDRRVTQLAVDGREPVAALVDLSNDERFRGLVICGIDAAGLRRSKWDDLDEYVDHYHERHGTTGSIDAWVGSAIQSRLVVVNPRVRLTRTIRGLFSGDFGRPSFFETRSDRSRRADFTLTDVSERRRHTIEDLQIDESHVGTDPGGWLRDLESVERAINRIYDRGGRVVLLRMPTTRAHREFDRRHYPRTEFWDRMAARTSAVTVHCEDVPELTGFDLPDDSHLDLRDTGRFTAALLNELDRQDVLPPSSSDFSGLVAN